MPQLHHCQLFRLYRKQNAETSTMCTWECAIQPMCRHPSNPRHHQQTRQMRLPLAASSELSSNLWDVVIDASRS